MVDKIKPSSSVALAELRELRLDAVILTGDNQITVDAIARETGSESVVEGVLPVRCGPYCNSGIAVWPAAYGRHRDGGGWYH